MIRGFLFLIGFGISVAGGISMIAYLNLFATGMSIMEFVKFLVSRPESYLLPIGILLVAGSIYLSGTREQEFRDDE